jgi:hypothetical protein
VNPEFPFLGASPDGLIDCKCCGKGVCEVKCPYCVKHGTIEDIAERGDKCLQKTADGRITLKDDHAYFYQVQTQIFLCNAEYCDFVLWTNEGLHVERILPDVLFWHGVLEECTKFFKIVILPELAGRLFTRSTIVNNPRIVSACANQMFCFCNKPESDRMAICSNSDCKYKKFHLSCLKLKIGPRSKEWVCRPCTQLKKAQAILAAKRKE